VNRRFRAANHVEDFYIPHFESKPKQQQQQQQQEFIFIDRVSNAVILLNECEQNVLINKSYRIKSNITNENNSSNNKQRNCYVSSIQNVMLGND